MLYFLLFSGDQAGTHHKPEHQTVRKIYIFTKHQTGDQAGTHQPPDIRTPNRNKKN